MAKQKTKIERQQQQQRFGDSMIDEVILIIIVVICIVVLISLLTKKMGILGSVLGDGLKGLFGISSILLPLTIIAYCCWLLGSEQKKNREVRIAGIALLLVTISALAHIINPIETSIMANLAEIVQSYYQEGEFNNGGLLGGILGGIIKKAFGKIGAGIIWSAVLLISLIMITGKSLFKGVKNKRNQYHEKRQQIQTVKTKEIPLQVVPKATKPQPKPQPKPQVKPQPQPKPYKKVQKKQNIKNKSKQKSNFNILLRADEGYNQNKEETPIVEAMVFQNKKEQPAILETVPKTPVIFDYGKTESEVLAEQQQNNTEQLYQQTPDNTVNNIETQSDTQIDAEKEKREEMRRRRIEREKLRELERQQQKLLELERQQQQKLQQQNKKQVDTHNTDKKQELTPPQQNEPEQNQSNTIRYMIFDEEQSSEQTEQVKSDTEDIADVLALLNSIHFEEEAEKENTNQNTQDIMEIIADWAEQEQEIPQSNGLSLVLAEEDTEQIDEMEKKKNGRSRSRSRSRRQHNTKI